ncbi:hypothetical protein SAMN05443637_10389 [Pseudonocardia thermophila]|uniref:DUF4386 family protein n=1 Tax=Pseudonocardia thermophila TaxID=1848 RepID=A0A1M6Q4V8_PSETH|nr:hypothetical protein [Pseudonocardia thermophila]SHK15156.1 hypothetical protein SAMN05443637_10389 [Pseudonocardia thermophila]
MAVSTERPDLDTPVSALARAAGASGVLFALLFTAALVLVQQGPGLDDPDAAYTAFYASGAQSLLVAVGLYIVPFAGIACLWHMIATRTYLQALAPTTAIPAWLHLASGVLFVALLFAGTAAAGGVALLSRFSGAPPPTPDTARALAAVGYTMVFVYAVRAAGMYIITTTGLARGAGVLGRPLAAVSYLVAFFLLVSTTFLPAVLLVFPAWVLLGSVLLLVRRPARPDHGPGGAP